MGKVVWGMGARTAQLMLSPARLRAGSRKSFLVEARAKDEDKGKKEG